MAEEKQTPELEPVNDTMSMDDTDMLREVLQDSHSHGIVPVSIYNESDAETTDF